MSMPMELRDLRAFLAVVRTGSFTAAAGELGYTQSAVSQQIATLEGELGRPLLQRRPVRPTPAGERLAEHAARILLRVDVARSELARLDLQPLAVRLAVCPLAAPRLVAGALRDLRARAPSLRVHVHTVARDRALTEVATGGVDAAVVDGITAPGNPLSLTDAGLVLSTPLLQSPLVVALPAGHPLQGRPSVDLDVLTDAPWVVPPPVGASRAPAPVSYDGTDLPTMLALVAAGHGAALLPAAACDGDGAVGVVGVPLGAPRLVHRTELLRLRALTGAQTLVVDALAARAELS
jgi:DNA-binding transcriptional LysR family regulator